ncbi:MAG: hypothetical protein HY510_05255 [Acidobacteria bacterium]|nr:hypothetical protein [Acidobacteriota bacterium]
MRDSGRSPVEAGGGGRNAVLAIALVVALGFSACLVAYTLRQRKPPIPADPGHLKSVEAPQCLSCHGPLGTQPRGRNHPLNDRCFNCHERT